VSNCPQFLGANNADDLVNGRISWFSNLAGTAITELKNLLPTLAAYQEGWAPTDINPFEPVNFGSFEELSAIPSVPSNLTPDFGDVEPPDGIYLDVYSPASHTIGPNTSERPDLHFPATPEDFNGTAPEPGNFLHLPPLPEDPDTDLPDPPDPVALNLPNVDDLNLAIPEFSETLPELNISYAGETFEFVEDPYDTEVKQAMEAEMLRVIRDYDLGLPPTVWNAITSQAQERILRANARLIQEIERDHSRRGFPLPDGVLDDKVTEARFEGHAELQAELRQFFVTEAQQKLEQLREYVSRAIQSEGQLIALHSQAMDRRLEAAKALVTLSVAVMEAKIALFNAQIAQYTVAAQVHKQLIEAELAKVEIFKAQIDAEKLKVDINRALVAEYVARIEAVSKQIDIYVARIDAIKTISDTNRSIAEQFAAQTRAFVAEVDAWKTEWEGYDASTRAQATRIQLYGEDNRAYLASVEGLNAMIRGESMKVDASYKEEQLKLGKYEADIGKYRAEIESLARQSEALSRSTDAEFQAYQARASNYAAFVDGKKAVVLARIEQAKITAQNAVEIARVKVAELEAMKQVGVEGVKAQIAGQTELTNALASGVNVSAAISDRFSQSRSQTSSCGESFNFNASV